MKIAVSGKGGVGKSTVAGALALLMVRRGMKVLAIDADPDANLASALGASRDQAESITPVSQMVDLIEKRTGAKVKHYGQIFKLNPNVSDITDRHATSVNGVSLLVLGAVDTGGGGCACPENVLLRALVTDVVLFRDDALVMDMEAGIEHLGRATARGVDILLVVVEPGQRSVETAMNIIRLAGETGIRNIQIVANKITGDDDRKFLQDALKEYPLLAMIPFSERIRKADRHGISVINASDERMIKIFSEILDSIIREAGSQG